MDRQRGRVGGTRTVLAAAAAIAAVLVVALGVATLTRSSSHSQNSGSGIQSASHLNGSSAGTMPACGAADFVVASVTSGPKPNMAGAVDITVRLTRTGTGPCSLHGNGPIARLVDSRHALVREGSNDELIAIKDLIVQPGDTVTTGATWIYTCGDRATPTALQLILQGSQHANEPPVTVSITSITPPACPPGGDQDQGPGVYGMFPRVATS